MQHAQPCVLACTCTEIRKDLILVDGQLGSCKSQVSAGQLLQQVEPAPRHKAPRAVTLQVAFEDDHLAVIHKPW
jgi:23S rRNA-/tRNA-specific pseudouridylate synthase